MTRFRFAHGTLKTARLWPSLRVSVTAVVALMMLMVVGLVPESTATATMPATSVLVPASGARLSGTASLDASASNATSVEFWILGGRYGLAGKMIGTATPTIYGWLSSWTTMSVPNASYYLVSEAFNATGSAFSAPVSITVSNPTTTSLLVPASGATLSGTASLDAAATNASSVEFLLSGGSYGSTGQVIGTATQTVYGWLSSWNTMTVPNGTYALVSEASGSGGSVFSAPVSITVSNAPAWSQFHFGPSGSGDNNNETAINVGNVGSLVPLFSARAGSNSDSSPAVANGILYEGADDHMLYAVRRCWRHQLLRHAEEMRTALVCLQRKFPFLFAGGRQWCRLRGLQRRHLRRVRRRWRKQLLGYAEDMRTTVESQRAWRNRVITDGRGRSRLRRCRRRPVRLRRRG